MDFISALRERGVPEEIEFDHTWLHVQGLLLKCQTLMCKSSITDRHTELFQFEWVPDQVKVNTIIHDAAMMLLL